MPKRLENGLLVVVEGIDGAGKTFQCERLAECLRDEGWDVERLREPTDGPYGRRIRELAAAGRDDVSPRHEMELFLEDRREDVAENIRPALDRGAVVILDRYYYSSIAYQGARGLDPAEVRTENEKIAPPADLLIYVTIPLELSRDRIETERGDTLDLFENAEYLARVKAIFDAMTDPQLVAVDGSPDPDAVFASILDAVRPALDSRSPRA